jgi:sortase A
VLREYPLLKVGLVMMAFALALTGATVAVMLLLRDKPADRVAASEIAAKSPSITPPLRATPRPAKSPLVEEKGEPQPAAESTPRPPAPEPRPRPAPQPQPEPKPERPETLPADEDNWQKPTQEEIEAASEPRRYELPPAAIMSLTVEKMNIYNVPVFDSDTTQALRDGVGHVPETSLPWSPTPQRNVYLAGHRMGYRGTWSRMVFYHLDELGEGDEIVLEDRSGKVYRYRVGEVFVARPVDSWVMGQVRGRDMVTLQSCTPIPTFEERLIVRADRV